MLFSYDAQWQYQTPLNEVPEDPAAVTVPDTGWTLASAPFGNEGYAWPYTENTAWAPGDGLWVRRTITVDGNKPVIIKGLIENAFFFYFDGVYLGTVNPTNPVSDRTDETLIWKLVVPAALATAGNHQIAFLCLNEGVSDPVTYFYAEADYLPANMISLQPRAPVSERLEWLTDVITSKDGTEDRAQLRINPRQTYKYIYPADSEHMRGAFNLVFKAQGQDWLLPVWTHAQQVGVIDQGDISLSANLDYYALREHELALIWESPENWQLVGLDVLASGTATFTMLANGYTNAWIMPVVAAHIPSNTVKRLAGHRAEFEVTFQVDEVLPLTVSAPTQYASQDIYFDAGLLSDGGELSDDISTRLDLHDEELGIVKYFAPWLQSKVARTHSVIADGAQEAWELREWLYRRAGRYLPFWQPSFEPDLRCTDSGAVTTALTVARDPYLETSERTHIAVETKSGWTAAEVTNITPTSATDLQLTLSASLGLNAEDILRISWLGLKRLNTDVVEINWQGAGVCSTDIRLLEIDT